MEKSPVDLLTTKNSWQEDEIDFRLYFSILLANKWIVFSSVLVFFMMGYLYSWQIKPMYQADVLLQIVDGHQGGLSGLEDISSLMLASPSAVPAEMEIILSRKILGGVVGNLHLDTFVKPLFFPVFGEAIARSFTVTEKGDIAPPLFGQIKYAWGGESIRVETLNVTPEFLNQILYLKYIGDSKYVIEDLEGHSLLRGVVGKLEKSDLIEVFVSQIISRNGTYFELIKKTKKEAVSILKQQVKVLEKKKHTGLLTILVEGDNPIVVANIADEVANTYLRQSVERKSEEAKNALVFLKKQLPEVKVQLNFAQQRLNSYRQKRGSVNLQIETQSLLMQSVEVEKELSTLAIKYEELRQKFTDNHPLLQNLFSKRKQLELDKRRLNSEIRALPETEREVLQLAQDVQVNSELYTFLLNKTQELQVVKAAIVSNVNVIDYAEVPVKPFNLKLLLILTIFSFLGLFFAALFIFMRHILSSGIEDPSIIERRFGIPVFASLPHSNQQENLANQLKKQEKSKQHLQCLLAKRFPDDLFVESLRSLRTNLHFSLLDTKNNVVMFTGPSPNIGKSFVSINFAQVMADSGKSVLMIDGDLRKGHLHNYLGMKRGMGLSDVLIGDSLFEDTVIRLEGSHFHFLANGTIPPNPTELLMCDRFIKLIDHVSQQYDVVIIDTPPVLAVTDAVIIGKSVGTTFMLLRSARHDEREIEQAISYLSRVDIKIQGVIFNDLYFNSSGSTYGVYHYQYS